MKETLLAYGFNQVEGGDRSCCGGSVGLVHRFSHPSFPDLRLDIGTHAYWLKQRAGVHWSSIRFGVAESLPNILTQFFPQ